MCRNLHQAHIRMWAGDYTLSGLVGFEMRSKVIGVVGTGAIGAAACRIFSVRTQPDSVIHKVLDMLPMDAPRLHCVLCAQYQQGW